MKIMKNLKNMKSKQKMFLFYGGIVLVALYFIRQYLKNMDGFAAMNPVQQNSYYSFVPSNGGKSQTCKPYKGDCLVNNIYSDAKCTVPIKCVINYPPVINKAN
jgi:hypothetical protein